MNDQKHLDFLGIGAQKSGTSWLYENLVRIPEFGLPPIKELHYFDRSRDYPSPNKLSETLFANRIRDKKYLSFAIKAVLKNAVLLKWKLCRFYLKWFFSDYSDKWYLSLFREFEGYKGEITPSYSILNKEDIRRIHNLQPDVKLVLILRNPIERAWSSYRFYTRKMNNFNMDEIKTDDIIKFLERKGHSLRSDYIRTIDNYTSVFGNEQILICFYDAISDNPETLMNDILKHICGDTSISIGHLNLKSRVNESRTIDRPKEVEDHLKNKYHSQIKELSEKYGGYFTKWYEESYLDNSPSRKTTLSPTMYLQS